MNRKTNHLIFNDDIFSKIAYLKKLDKNNRPFVASKKFGDEASFLLEQILCHVKAKDKTPHFYENNCLFTQKSIAQATSELVAVPKSQAIFKQSKHKNKLICLTAGLGIDDFYLSQHFSEIISIDLDPLMHQIGEYNVAALKANNINRINENGEHYLSKNKVENTTIYIDPDRRAVAYGSNKQIEQFSPDIISLCPLLLKNNNEIFIKMPGIADITWLQKNLPSIESITVINEGEVKELLIHLCNNPLPMHICVLNINPKAQNTIITAETAINLAKLLNAEGTYIFHPIPGVIKAGFFNHLGIPIIPNIPFFKTNELSLLGYGKMYAIKTQMACSLKQLAVYLKQENIFAASVTARNTKLDSAQIKAFLKLKENEYIQIFIFGVNKSLMVLITERVWKKEDP